MQHVDHHLTCSPTWLARLRSFCGVVLLLGVLAGCQAGTAIHPVFAREHVPDDMHGIWVTRWDYRTALDVENAIDEIAAAGFTDVYWQVRGQADAYYRSSLEPWGQDLFRDRPDATDPGFDPLSVAVARAHEKGLRLHAWINVYPLWKGTTPPKDPRHPYNRRPDWRLFDQYGNPQPLNEHYVVANPTNPEVQAHIAAVCRDIVRRYAIDGLHLDYVRFVGDSLDKDKIYPADPASISRFYKATGHRTLSTKADRQAHRAWVRSEVTKLVERISREARRIRPGIELSAAVWRTPERAREEQLQDAPRWLEEGTIDRALPMIYTDDNSEFVRDLSLWLEAVPGRKITPGIGAYKQPPTQTLEQIRLARETRADGYCLFQFSTFFDSVNPFAEHSEAAGTVRAARRRALKTIQLGASHAHPDPASSSSAQGTP